MTVGGCLVTASPIPLEEGCRKGEGEEREEKKKEGEEEGNMGKRAGS